MAIPEAASASASTSTAATAILSDAALNTMAVSEDSSPSASIATTAAATADDGVLVPPAVVRDVVHTTVRFIVHKGVAFEARILASPAASDKLAFLHPENGYHAYNHQQLEVVARPVAAALRSTAHGQMRAAVGGIHERVAEPRVTADAPAPGTLLLGEVATGATAVSSNVLHPSHAAASATEATATSSTSFPCVLLCSLIVSTRFVTSASSPHRPPCRGLDPLK